jgi:cell division protein FtsB
VRAYLLIPVLVTAVIVLGVSDRESGLSTWFRVNAELRESNARISSLRGEIQVLEEEVIALRNDPFAIERAIREDLELARPGETVVRFPSKTEGPVPRLR